MPDSTGYKEIYEKGEQLCEIGESLMQQARDAGYSPDGDESMEEELPGEEEEEEEEVSPSEPKKKDKTALAISLFRKP